ncbi:MAG: hypothetical protein AAFY02_19460 [Pseudomonadota bacterium]
MTFVTEIKGLTRGLTRGLLVATALLGLALPAAAETKPAPPPPYLMKGMDSTLFAVTWEPGTIDHLLPEGITPVEGHAGGINLYSVAQGYGLSPYSSAYFYVSVEGYDSPDGTPGRYVFGGFYGPAAVAEAMVRHYDFKVRDGIAVQLVEDGVTTATAQMQGEPMFSIKVKNAASDCPAIAGTVNYVSPSASGDGMTVLEIPFAGDFCQGEAEGGLEVTAPEGDVLNGPKVAKILAAGHLKNASFSFTQPQVR